MFDVTRIRRWLFGVRTSQPQTGRLSRRLVVRQLEDRLQPGDILLTGWATHQMAVFGHPGSGVKMAPPTTTPPSGVAAMKPPVNGREALPVSLVATDVTASWSYDLGHAPSFDARPVRLGIDDLSTPVFVLPPWAGLKATTSTDPTATTPADASAPFRSVGPAPAEAMPAGDSAGLPAIASYQPTAPRTTDGGKAIEVKSDKAVGGPTNIGVTPTKSYTQTEILVGVRDDDPLGQLQAWAAKNADPKVQIDPAASTVLLTVGGVSTVEVKLANGTDPLAAVDRFAADAAFAWAVPNTVFYNAKDWTPNDPQYTAAGQYFHTKSQTDLAWDVTKGSPAVIVAIADDGMGYNHPDLTDNMWANTPEVNGLVGVDDDNNGFVDDIRGWDFNAAGVGDNTPLPSGADSHGTHVGGIVAARSNNLVGVAGTAGGDGVNANTGARLMNIKWAGPNGWTAAMVSNTYKYAADNGAKIVNASYNFDGFVGNPVVEAAFNYAYDKGLLLMNSAGNNGQLEAPRGVFTQPLFVASLNSADVRSSFSNYGTFVDVAAHGEGILSTTTSADGTGVNYEVYDGTSMSTPHAGGVAALIWSKNPTWSRDQVAAQLMGTADAGIYSIAGNIAGTLGAGRVNSNKAVTQTIAAPVLTNLTRVSPAGSPNQTASFSVTAPRRFDPVSVVAANFEVRSDGADNTFDTGDDVIIPVTLNGGAPYRMGTNTLSFAPTSGNPLPIDRYRFTALSGATQLRDPFGAALDGDANGTAGGNYVTIFGDNPQIVGRVFEDANGNGAPNANDPGIGGRSVYLDADGDGVFDSGTTPYLNDIPVAIGDNATFTSNTTVSGVAGAVNDVNVTVNITHTWDADLNVYLIAPDGTRVELFTAVGGSGDNFVNTVLDDQAATSIASGVAPFTGTFRPEGSLGVLNGKTGAAVNGSWTLEISDTAGGDTGTLNNWTLTISSGETTALADSAGAYAFLGLPNGSHTVRPVVPTGWVNTGAASHTVSITGPTSSFSDRDFGQAKNDRFYGYVWNDQNANGTVDGGEPPLAGRMVYRDLNGNGVFDTYTNVTNNTPVTIVDADGTTGTPTTTTTTTTVSGVSGTIQDINVTVNITHTWDEDLDVFLISPTGTRVELFTDVGSSGDNFTNTVLDDQAATLISAGAPPFTGTFRPEGSLAALNGQNANGTWTLELTDDVASDEGVLNSWTLSIATVTPEPFVTSNALGNAFLDLPAGASTVRMAPQAGWKYTSPADGKYAVTAAGAPLYSRTFGTAEAVAPTVTGVGVTPTVAPFVNQRSMVTSLIVTFSERVVLPATPATAFTLDRTTGGGAVVGLSASVDDSGPTTVVTLTFTNNTDQASLVDGRYTLTVLAAQVKDVAQNPMAANVTVDFHRLYGDLDGNAQVNGQDAGFFDRAFGSVFGQPAFVAAFDWNGDNQINGQDAGIFDRHFGQTI
jgi:subtilisin-like proprotein convertase family protein/subtilisin family serine protease